MTDVLGFARNLRDRGRRMLAGGGFFFGRPLVLLQSDDWGRVGVRDREGFAELHANGIALGENPYDFYSLETAEDLNALSELLQRHSDSIGRSPCVVMNFVLANVDFERCLRDDSSKLHFRLLRHGLPENWNRPLLLEAYRAGIRDGVFYPALHGLSHFCQRAMECLAHDELRRDLLRRLWKAGTPYIYWRMPWIGYEYWSAHSGFLPAAEQDHLVDQGAAAFIDLFGVPPVSACAPGYRANRNTHSAWGRSGVRVAQNGSGSWQPPQIDEFGILHLHRNVDFEPAVHVDFSVERCLARCEESFARRLPAVISVHSINFHSSLRNYRGATLQALDELLHALDDRHPDLLYVHDQDMREIVERSGYESARQWVPVPYQQSWRPGVVVGAS